MILLNKKFYSSQRMLMLSFLALIVLPVLLLSALYYAYAMDTVTESTERNYHEIVSQLGNTLDKDINLLQANVDSLALNDIIFSALTQGGFSKRNSDMTKTFLQIDKVISDIMSGNPSLFTVLLLDHNQGVYHYRRMLYVEKTDIFKTEWYRQALLRRGATFWDGTWYNNDILTEPVNLFGASRAVIDKTTYQTVGVLYITIRESAFSYLTDAQDDGAVYVTDAMGRVLLTNRKQERNAGHAALDISDFSPTSSGSLETKLEGVRYLTVYSKPLHNGWRVIKQVSQEERLGEMASLRAQILVIIALCFAAFGVFLFVTFKRITQPLQYMVNLVNEIDSAAEGQLDIASLPCYELIRINDCMLSLVEKNKTTANELRFTRKQSEQNELSMLQAQLNPHFIYNTLGMIKSMLLEQSQQEIAAVMTAFIKLLRSSMDRDGTYVSVSQEIENIRHYLLIQRSLYGYALQFELAANENCMDIMVPNFLLQPLVENAIYHGVDPVAAEARISISAIRSEDKLVLCVEDNGVGMSEEMLMALRHAELEKANAQKASPFGLLALDRKLFLLYGGDYTFLVNLVNPHGTRITLKLPVRGGVT